MRKKLSKRIKNRAVKFVAELVQHPPLGVNFVGLKFDNPQKIKVIIDGGVHLPCKICHNTEYDKFFLELGDTDGALYVVDDIWECWEKSGTPPAANNLDAPVAQGAREE